MDQFGKLPLFIVLIIATIVAGVILKVSDSRTKKKKAEEERRAAAAAALARGEKPEYWKDANLLDPEDGRTDEFFKDDQL